MELKNGFTGCGPAVIFVADNYILILISLEDHWKVTLVVGT